MGRSVIISWVTPIKKYPNTVRYWEADGSDKHGHGHGHKYEHKHEHKHVTHAITTTYRYYNYTSGFIHHATINRLRVRYLTEPIGPLGFFNFFVFKNNYNVYIIFVSV